MDADLVLVDLLGVLDPTYIGGVEYLVGRVRYEIERVDHVFGVEGLPVLKLDALAKVELERQIIDPAPGRGQRGFVFEGFRIAVNQLIPNHPRQDDALAVGIEVSVGIVDLLVPSDPERVVCLVCEDRRRPRSDTQGRRYAGYRGRC